MKVTLGLPQEYINERQKRPCQRRTEWGSCRAAAPPKKNIDCVDAIISKVLCDLPFSRNQPLKSTDECYIGVLKRKKRKNVERIPTALTTSDAV